MKKMIFMSAAILGLFISISAAPGDLDATFDGDGKVTYQFLNHTYRANDLAIQPDGKIVLAGIDGFAFGDFAVVRFNADGSPDAGFGTGGRAVTPVVAKDDEILAVVVQPDGKIVAAGYANTDPDNPSVNDFAIVRYNPNGTLDTTFDGDGIFLTSFGTNDLAYAVALQPDGKILAAGIAQEIQISTHGALVRLNADGTPDASFNGNGKVILTTSVFETFRDIVVQPDGKIVVVGASDANGARLVRYHANGAIDLSFDGDGVSIFVPDSQFTAAALQPDGKIVAAGYNHAVRDTAIARYKADGTLDQGFSGNGYDFLPLPGEFSEEFTSVAIQINGKIVAGGGTNDFHIARYNADGTLDGSLWGTNGIVTTDLFSGSSDNLNALKIQPDGKIVAAGLSATLNGTIFAAARYFGDSAPPTAAGVSISGAVLSGKGGISRARVSLVDMNGNSRTVLTGSFGYFRFTNVPAGRIYVVSVAHKNYVFNPDSQVLNVADDLSGIDFTTVE